MPEKKRSESVKSDHSSSSSSSSSSSESIRMVIKQKHSKHGKKHCSKDKSKSHSHSKGKKHNHGKKHHKSKSCSSSSKSSSSKSCKSHEKYTFEDLYNCYKWKLLEDPELMVNGSDAYINSYDNKGDIVPRAFPVNFEYNSSIYNVDHPSYNAPFVVRKSGTYIFFFVSSNEQSCQYSIFINGKFINSTTSGNNAGAGQFIFRNILNLNKDDTIIVRNYLSSSTIIQSNPNMGGSQNGNNETFLLMKIAPLQSDDYKKDWDKKSEDNNKCLSRRKKYLFKKLLEKMLCDKDLMLKGFNTRGTFYSITQQTVFTEAPVVFTANKNVNNLTWDPLNPSNIVIKEDGIYKVFSLATIGTPAQLSFAVNGIPINFSTQGLNKGAGQLTLRTLLELKAGDILTLINHTSVNGQIILTEKAGGNQQSISVILTIFKIAPITKPIPIKCNINEYYEKCFDQYKKYLLCNKHLQIEGSSAYISSAGTHSQDIALGESINYEFNIDQKEIYHSQGTSDFIIEKDGIYDIFSDVITNEASQLTLFVNGIPDLSAIGGRDSGANRCLLRQFISFKKGDVVTIRNYSSYIGTLHTSLNTGGEQVGHPVFFMLFLLCPEEHIDSCPPPCYPPSPPKCDKKSK